MQFDKEKILAMINQRCKNTLMETLQIEYIEVGDEYLVAKMPVTPRVHQPDGILHGGATVALAESVGSAASLVFLDTQDFIIRGIEISANHLKSVAQGEVYATTRLLHKGRTTQLWEIKITDQQQNIISICKLTTIRLPKAN
ncbi:PaaI family thioesterase [Galbibacter sp.]|uniref:PaaI family thioesterase n=1 Tax=Galbibacter sp. TaxID=2918471 RepID=UPI002D1FACAB|nr:PaaI family thioesterase [Galbibacter sp.]